MANIPSYSGKFKIDQVATYLMGGDTDEAGQYQVQILGSFTGSITVKARPLTKEASADGDNIALTAWWYRTNAGVIATAPLTAAASITIPTGGVEVALDVTALSAGTPLVYVSRVKGVNI
jgi:hypothetical protein